MATIVPDLLSLVLTLRPAPQVSQAQRPIPRWWGRAAHALFLRVIGTTDPDLAQRLHDEEGVRPFTASNLLGTFPHGRLDPEQRYTLRYTALTAEVAALLIQAARTGMLAPGATLILDDLPFQVLAVAMDGTAHPWAATTSFTELSAQHLLPHHRPPRRLTLHFASPTGFHSNGRTQPLPLPELVFGNLLERWNRFAPVALPEAARQYAAECLVVSRFNLRSQAVPLKEGGLRIGTVGEVAYTTRNYDRYWMGVMSALAALAQFSGVGVAVSAGMGQCRWRPDDLTQPPAAETSPPEESSLA
ncbi:CRISPR system precrRNA processing endoribonuclease RAMP protein Cas6 [uncultured Thermanaerothrix sp.]|uniref:CRISPR system precrRNA processing endoribonuclease RAMP protein Cas6 n=1 Tax=uncultured Thermanaerothrix sp. TaxID=1195149 RepID=UPI0026069CEC|nr:CRISPR system precrRNA processing endoribonuclease RAMP protein Cas6 [uncultured Thermanaerothrix sp.]